MNIEQVKKKLKEKALTVIFPKDEKSEAAAKQVADSLESSIGIAAFKNDEGELYYGILINELKQEEENEKNQKADNGDDSKLQNESMLLS